MMRPWLPYAATCGVMLLAGLLLFPSAGRDDTHISCWPAYSLAHSGDIVNYNGERVEQSSSLLHVLLLAMLSFVTRLDPVGLSRLLSVLFGIGSVAAVAVLAKREATPAVALPSAILTALSVYFIYWAFGGLETTMVCCIGMCVIISVAAYLGDRSVGSLLRPVFACLLFLLTRPEAPFLLLGVLGLALILVRVKASFSRKAMASRKIMTVKLLILLATCAVLSCAIMVFRFWYFDAAFPQPVDAKFAGISFKTMQNGISYLAGSLFGNNEAMTATVLVAIIAIVIVAVLELAAKEFNLYALLALVYCAAYLAFAILSGGDWMEGGRFLVFFLPVAMAFIPVALARLTERQVPLVLVTVVIAGLQAATIIEFACYSSTGMPLWAAPLGKFDASDCSWFERHNRVNLRDAPVTKRLDAIIERLAAQRKEPVVVMSGQMGATAYHLAMKHRDKIRLMDRFGLTDRTFLSCSTTGDLPRGRMGLQLWYDFFFSNLNALVKMDRLQRPDIIFDIGSIPDRQLTDNGYVAVYRQTGRVVSNSSWFPGRDVIANEFIAVRTNLLGVLDNPRPVSIEFGM